MVVIFIRLVYHDAPLVRLELEVTDAILLDVLHHIRKHRLDEVCTYIAIVTILGTQTFTDIPNKVAEIEGGKSLFQPDRDWRIGIFFRPMPYFLAKVLQLFAVIDIGRHGISGIIAVR